MKKDTEILSSFDLKKGLNPKVWVKDNKSTKLKPEIREKLLEIAYEFIEFLGVDIVVSDAHIIGSMVNYNWSKYSDFDLHIIADFEQFPKEQLGLYQELFKLKKTLFNSNHNIKIYGYDVELYVQDSNEDYFSSGAYSLIYNKWLSPPKKTDFKADKELLMSKVNQWTEKIDEVIDSAKGKDLEPALKLLGGFKDKLKKYRQSGLEGGGELSYENLVFKYLRRNGYIEKLFNFEKEKVDRELSLEQKLTEQEKIKDFLYNLFSGKKDKKTEVKIDDPKKADLVDDDVTEFYKTLESIKEPISQQQKGKMNFQKDVETIQIALDLLGYKLPVFGIDGLYGPETGSAVEKFKVDNPDTIGKDEELPKEEKSKVLPPVSMSRITSNFGRRWGRQHSGVDIGVTSGTDIKSPADGEVVDADFKPGSCGGTIAIKHGDNIKTRYCHCKRIDVSVGDKVKQGEVVGLTGGGSSDKGKGNSQGPHLHFEVYLNGSAVDPLTIIDKKYVGKYVSGSINSVTTPKMITDIINKLKSKGIKSEDLKKYLDIVKSGKSSKIRTIGKLSDLPIKIRDSIKKMIDKYGLEITDQIIYKEIEQEGGFREDAGAVNAEAKSKIQKLISDAKSKFPKIASQPGIISDYRSYDSQVDNFGSKSKSRGVENTQKFNALPGFSQHHTGKAFDIFSTESSWWEQNKDVKDWVQKNAKRYGFAVTYQKIGQLRQPEPWHLYYGSDEVSSNENKKIVSKKTNDKDYIVYVPENYTGGEAHVLFAGLNSFKGGKVSLNENFYGPGLNPIKGKLIVVITHWGNTVPNAQKYIKETYNAKVTSIAGFSKGGMRMWDYVGPKSSMKFVGLIDPSPEGNGSGENPYINLDFGNNTYMICNWKNWGNKPPGYVPREVLKWYCDHQNDSEYSGKVTCTNKNSYDHSEIFKNFYNKFSNKI